MTGKRSDILSEIPLYLVPQAVARMIRLQGKAVYRISVVRTHWHHYNVRVRTSTCQKELRPACATRPGSGFSGGLAGGLPVAMEGSRGCPA